MARIFFSHNNFFNGIISVKKKTQIPPDCGQLPVVSITFSTGRQLVFTGKQKYYNFLFF